MKVALVYDRINKWGGAERVIIALRKMFPNAPLFTSVYRKDRASWAKKIPVTASFLQKVPFASGFHEGFAPLMPLAFESFSFDEFDLVISVTSEAAKGIITKPATKHISLILTPTRYLWSGYRDYFPNIFLRIIAWPVVAYLRFWDRLAARRPDRLIAISSTVQARIKKYYGLDSEIAYPPLMIKTRLTRKGNGARIEGGLRKTSPNNDTGFVTEKRSTKNYFLVVSRLVAYKRIDIAVRAANKLHAPLKIIGTGSEFARLKKMAGPTVEFLSYVTDADLKYYYTNCRALLFPGVEDFGLTMVEAQAFGKPIIAYRGGGAEEIILEGKTGKFFEKQNAQSLAEVLKKFRPGRYNSKACRKNAGRFSFEQFEKKILLTIND